MIEILKCRSNKNWLNPDSAFGELYEEGWTISGHYPNEPSSWSAKILSNNKTR
jgi:hypothetical protein